MKFVFQAFLGDTVVTDPTLTEEKLCRAGIEGEGEHGIFTVGLLPTFNQVSQLFHTGHVSPGRFQEMISETASLGSDVHKAVQATLLSSVKGAVQSATKT